MPDLDQMLADAQANQKKKKFSRGIRPDHLTREPVSSALTGDNANSAIVNNTTTEIAIEPIHIFQESKATENLRKNFESNFVADPVVTSTALIVEPNLSQSEVKFESNISQTRAKIEPIIDLKTESPKKLEPQSETIHKPNLSQSAVKVGLQVSESAATITAAEIAVDLSSVNNVSESLNTKRSSFTNPNSKQVANGYQTGSKRVAEQEADNGPISQLPNNQATNREQTENKLGTNWEQTQNKVGTQPEQNSPFTYPNSKQIKNGAQTDTSTEPNRVQTGSNGFSKRVQTGSMKPFPTHLNPNEPVSNRVQTGSDTGSVNGAKAIPLGELSVLRFIADLEAVPGEAIAIRRRDVAEATAQTLEGVKTALKRLSRAGLIELFSFQRGAKTGFTAYKVHPNGREILASKSAIGSLGFKRVQTGSDTGSLGFFSSSVLKSEKFKKTTTDDHEKTGRDADTLSPDWAEIDLEPLDAIGFKPFHLRQIARSGKISPSETQESIHYFAFDLSENKKASEIKKTPLEFFLGILKNGPYAAPQNYESPADAARRKNLEFKLAQQKKQQELLKAEMEADFFEWKNSLSLHEINLLLPDYAKKQGPAQNAALKIYFEENIWRKQNTENQSMSAIEIREIIQKSLRS